MSFGHKWIGGKTLLERVASGSDLAIDFFLLIPLVFVTNLLHIDYCVWAIIAA